MHTKLYRMNMDNKFDFFFFDKKGNILTWTFRVYEKKKKKKKPIDTNQVISLPTRLVAKTKFETSGGACTPWILKSKGKKKII